MTSLTVLRERSEHTRFERQHHDDTRTAIADAQALAADLRRRLEGEVRFDDGSRALYATDASNYRQVPIGVVIPRHAGDVEATVEVARRHGAPILGRGAGTSLAGQCCNVAVVLDFSKYMNRILEIDPARQLARVQPGCVLDHLRDEACHQHQLTFAPDPETHEYCTLGGMLGNNSCGVHSLIARNNGLGLRVSDNTHELEVLTYAGHRLRVGPTPADELERIIRGGGTRGELYARLKALRDKDADVIRERMPKLGRRVSGYNLDELLPENGFNVARALVGTESTCAIILEATLHLVPAPKEKSLLVLGYPDIYSAAEHLLEILEFKPTGLEGMDHWLFKFVKDKGDENANLALLPPGGGYLLVEFGGDSRQDADDQARRLMDHLKRSAGDQAPSMKLIDDPQQETMIWNVRKGSLGSTAWVPGMSDTWEGWEDSAVPVPKVSYYLRELRKLLDKHGYKATLYGHLGQGCIHTRIPFDLYTADGIKSWRQFMEEATDLIVECGGSFSGEHGDGQSRGEFLPKLFGSEMMKAFHEFKRIWDPDNRMNPGKVINLDGPPYGLTDNLRVGPDYNPPQAHTHFAYTGDKNSFARAALRCVGVGKCRARGDQTMCPSYMVTHEEKHSTRGRARMLFEMMNGEVIRDGWKSDEVKDALDLCLSCKGCKGDCPVNVDMATYKAEFLSHYYEGRLRPRHAYAFGHIHLWSRLASAAPMLANFFTQMPGIRAVAKWVAGADSRRPIPAFAPQTFKAWFADHRPRHPAGNPVILFPDTFSNFFTPDIGKAAVEVLEDAGFRVLVPEADVCCGRPLYDYGWLDSARRHWENLLHQYQPYIQAGIPMVVLEPSCWSAFKDELTNLMPQNLDAIRLKELTFTFSDFLRRQAPDYRVPPLPRKALLHGHCHQKALDELNDKEFGKLFAEKEILTRMKVQHRDPETGCCGMAGAFGYEAGEHYDVSQACGERVLLPEVRHAGRDELIIADGFSCRSQIEQNTARHALHLAQVMRLAIHSAPRESGTDLPEAPVVRAQQRERRVAALRTAALAAVGFAVGVSLYRAMHTRQKES
jgi:FAD/FMN-containing dehydrogenase/Fe-S oxidoreductase